MKPLPDASDDPGCAVTSLRERKKARTKAAIRDHALRLFIEQGYDATTIDQIAEAADISPSTFFRYYPNKEDVATQDDYDDHIVARFRAQPAEATPIQAIRTAIKEVFTALPPERLELERSRQALIYTVPELRAKALDSFLETVRLLASIVAERTGRSPEDMAVRTLAGAIVGVAFSTTLAAADDPDADLMGLLDEGLGCLEAGLPL